MDILYWQLHIEVNSVFIINLHFSTILVDEILHHDGTAQVIHFSSTLTFTFHFHNGKTMHLFQEENYLLNPPQGCKE